MPSSAHPGPAGRLDKTFTKLIAGAYAMADESAAAQGELFADVGAAALSQAEMESVDGDGFGRWFAEGVAWEVANKACERATGMGIVDKAIDNWKKTTKERDRIWKESLDNLPRGKEKVDAVSRG